MSVFNSNLSAFHAHSIESFCTKDANQGISLRVHTACEYDEKNRKKNETVADKKMKTGGFCVIESEKASETSLFRSRLIFHLLMLCTLD